MRQTPSAEATDTCGTQELDGEADKTSDEEGEMEHTGRVKSREEQNRGREREKSRIRSSSQVP